MTSTLRRVCSRSLGISGRVKSEGSPATYSRPIFYRANQWSWFDSSLPVPLARGERVQYAAVTRGCGRHANAFDYSVTYRVELGRDPESEKVPLKKAEGKRVVAGEAKQSAGAKTSDDPKPMDTAAGNTDRDVNAKRSDGGGGDQSPGEPANAESAEGKDSISATPNTSADTGNETRASDESGAELKADSSESAEAKQSTIGTNANGNGSIPDPGSAPSSGYIRFTGPDGVTKERQLAEDEVAYLMHRRSAIDDHFPFDEPFFLQPFLNWPFSPGHRHAHRMMRKFAARAEAQGSAPDERMATHQPTAQASGDAGESHPNKQTSTTRSATDPSESAQQDKQTDSSGKDGVRLAGVVRTASPDGGTKEYTLTASEAAFLLQIPAPVPFAGSPFSFGHPRRLLLRRPFRPRYMLEW